MSLSKETIEKLRIVKEAILAQPEYYNQEGWVSSIESCGTTCCMAGWVDFIFNGKEVHERRAKKLYDPCDSSSGADEWSMVTKKALGLSLDQVHSLTSTSYGWPGDYGFKYRDATTRKQKSKVAAARIEHFIATGGEE